jgi:crossover junction endodeoxyribonuclease RusA
VNEVRFVVPLVPISVNHYAKHTRTGRHYVTKEAIAYKHALAIFAGGQKVVAKRYRLVATVYLGKGQRGDGDNFNKCIGDGLKEAGVVHSDAAIKDWRVLVERDWEHPRTDITITAI